MRYILFSILALCLGIAVGYFVFFRTPVRSFLCVPGNKTIGFLPYWLLGKARNDYSQYLNGVAYFGLTVGDKGNIVKLTNPQEENPGWYDLRSGKVNPFLTSAKKNNESLSLVVFSGDNASIGNLIQNPTLHADNLISEVSPIMKRYGFSDLNLDLEYSDTASQAARLNFTRFVREVKKDMTKNKIQTLSIDVSPSAFIKNYLIDPSAVSKIADFMIIMGYDYHYPGSFVTGPIAPLFGAGSVSEFDIQTAVEKALLLMPGQKIILGAPLYGYEWETIGNTPRSPVIPGTGVTISSKSVKSLLAACATCSARFDNVAQEKYIIYKDTAANSYHQIFYPDIDTMEAKVRFAQKYNLGGIALWALGYEDNTILNPLKNY